MYAVGFGIFMFLVASLLVGMAVGSIVLAYGKSKRKNKSVGRKSNRKTNPHNICW
jgi:hypothetical protein